MTVTKSDIIYYIERIGNYLEDMTDDEMEDIALWCNRVITKRQIIEDDIIRNAEMAISAAQDSFDEVYRHKISVNFRELLSESSIIDDDDIYEYTIDKAIEKLYPDFPILENIDSFDRENIIDELADVLTELCHSN